MSNDISQDFHVPGTYGFLMSAVFFMQTLNQKGFPSLSWQGFGSAHLRADLPFHEVG